MNLDGSVLRPISFTDGKVGVISRKDVKRSMPRLRESTVATTLLLEKFNEDPFSYSIRSIGSFRVVMSLRLFLCLLQALHSKLTGGGQVPNQFLAVAVDFDWLDGVSREKGSFSGPSAIYPKQERGFLTGTFVQRISVGPQHTRQILIPVHSESCCMLPEKTF